jgi:hypothetical protein
VEQPLGRREILQPVLAERLGGHRVPYCVAHRRSHHDLPAVRGGLDARRQVDIDHRTLARPAQGTISPQEEAGQFEMPAPRRPSSATGCKCTDALVALGRIAGAEPDEVAPAGRPADRSIS